MENVLKLSDVTLTYKIAHAKRELLIEVKIVISPLLWHEIFETNSKVTILLDNIVMDTIAT